MASGGWGDGLGPVRNPKTTVVSPESQDKVDDDENDGQTEDGRDKQFLGLEQDA